MRPRRKPPPLASPADSRRRERSRDEILEAARRVLLARGGRGNDARSRRGGGGAIEGRALLLLRLQGCAALRVDRSPPTRRRQRRSRRRSRRRPTAAKRCGRSSAKPSRTFAGQSRRFPPRLPVRSGGGIRRGQAQRRAVRAGAAAERPSAQGRDAKAQGGRRAAGRTTPDGFPGLRLRPWRAHHEGHGGEHERPARLYRRSTRGWPCFGVRGGRTRFTRVWSSKPPPGPPARIGATVKAPVAPHAVGSL